MGAAFCKSIGISVDHRRKNRSVESLEMNKNRLLAYVNNLALFPRKAAHPKKGLVNDSVKDVCANAVQHVQLALPVLNLREKSVLLTKEMKANKVYNKQCLEEMNKKWRGLREKKIRE